MVLAKHLICDDDGNILRIAGNADAMEYVEKFFDLPSVKVKKSRKSLPKKYITLNGFSHPDYVTHLPSQGLVKTVLAAIKVLSDKAAMKDSEAVKMLRVLAVFMNTQPDRSMTEIRRRLSRAAREMKAEPRTRRPYVRAAYADVVTRRGVGHPCTAPACTAHSSTHCA